MKKTIIILFVFLSSSVFSQKQITGVWLNQDKDAEIKIIEKNNKYYGKITWLLNPKNEKGNPKKDTKNPNPKKQKENILGLEIIKNLEFSKKEWNKGTIYDPKTGKTYKLYAKIKDKKLHLRGYVGVSLIGRTNTWTRVK